MHFSQPSAALLLSALVPIAISQANQSSSQGFAAASLRPAISLPSAITNGVAVTPDGSRTFVVIAKQKGQQIPEIAEWSNGQLHPYPDAAWNSWKPGQDASHSFQHANSVRFGPNGLLWAVDVGSPEMGKPTVPHGPKIVGMNIHTGKVVKIVYFDSVTSPNSFLDDVRFDGSHAYLTDAGDPGLIVLDQTSGRMWRALNHAKSTTASGPLTAEGHTLVNAQNRPVYLHADQLEVSPDGKTLYFMPCTGPMSAINTQYLDNEHMSDAERNLHVRLFAPVGNAGGTSIDAKGNVYVSDTNNDRVLRMTPEGHLSTVVQDRRLVWVDAMWISADGRLWMPAAQLDRTPSMNHNKMAVHFPMVVYTANIGVGPSPIDHPDSTYAGGQKSVHVS